MSRYERLPTSSLAANSIPESSRISTSSEVSDSGNPSAAGPASPAPGYGAATPATLAVEQADDGQPRPQLEAHHVDGVFANLMAVPGPEEKLPSYFEAVGVPPTSHLSTAVVRPSNYANPFLERWQVSDDGEFLVEGLPVGGWVVFGVNMVASIVFDFVGFMLTFFLSTSHAAREGSRTGLGITLVRYGLFVLHRSRRRQSTLADDPATGSQFASGGMMDDGSQGDGMMDGGDGQDPYGDDYGNNEWVAYLLMIVGWALVLKSTFSYVRCRRIQNAALYSSEIEVRETTASTEAAVPRPAPLPAPVASG